MYLFTDFDGVLHPAELKSRDFRCLPLLNQYLAEFPNIELVISSAWKDRYTLDELKAFLGAAGQRVVGVTPSFSSSFPGVRSEEVNLFIKSKGIKPWLALDDLAEHFRSEDNDKVIICDEQYGLTQDTLSTLRTKTQALLANL